MAQDEMKSLSQARAAVPVSVSETRHFSPGLLMAQDEMKSLSQGRANSKLSTKFGW